MPALTHCHRVLSGKECGVEWRRASKPTTNVSDTVGSKPLPIPITNAILANTGRMATGQVDPNPRRKNAVPTTARSCSAAGKGWYDMTSPPMTDEIKTDLKLLSMREVLNPTRFYKDKAKKKVVLPKVFQIGTVIEGAGEFYSARIPRKQRVQHLIQEVCHDTMIRCRDHETDV